MGSSEIPNATRTADVERRTAVKISDKVYELSSIRILNSKVQVQETPGTITANMSMFHQLAVKPPPDQSCSVFFLPQKHTLLVLQ